MGRYRSGDLSSGKIGDEGADVEIEIGQAPDVTVSPIPRSSAEIACEPTPRPPHAPRPYGQNLRARAAADIPIDERPAVTIAASNGIRRK